MHLFSFSSEYEALVRWPVRFSIRISDKVIHTSLSFHKTQPGHLPNDWWLLVRMYENGTPSFYTLSPTVYWTSNEYVMSAK